MSKHSLLYLGLAASGLLFMGAQNLESDQIEVGALRPRPGQNRLVPNAGYLVVTTPGGEWITDRRDVMSVSCHTYEVSAGMRVWEVTVSERSANTVRFYYSKPIAPIPVNAGSPSEEGTGGKLDSLDGKSTTTSASAPASSRESGLIAPVRKDYPETTHAHTIEFRISDLAELDGIYAYLTLMVYGWSPKAERPVEARSPRVHEVSSSWHDWDQPQGTK